MIRNEKGLSLPEIIISLGLMGAIGIGVATLITQTTKKQSEMDHRLNRMTLEKMFENYYYSDKGCDSLIGKAVGDAVVLNPKDFSSLTMGKTEFQELRIKAFSPSDDTGINGIANLTLTLKEKEIPNISPEKTFLKEIPVPVNIQLVGGKQVIQDCRLNYNQVFTDIKTKVCEGTFGTMTEGMTCSEAIALVESKIIKEICDDIYSDKPAEFSSIHCNVKQIHANKDCGANNVFTGFDHKGHKICQPVPTVSWGPAGCSTWSLWSPADLSSTCTYSTVHQTRTCLDSGSTLTEARDVAGEKTCVACASWSPWTPDESAQCTTADVNQSRNCLDGGSTVTETRTIKGKKDCGGGDCIYESPFEWQNFDEKVGFVMCTDGTPTPMKMKNYQAWTGHSTKGDSGAFGSITFQCVDGAIKIITYGCTIISKDISCPQDTTYCTGKPAGGGGIVYSWGYLKYGPKPACKQSKEPVASYHFTGSELKAGMKEGCPPPFGDSNVDD